MKRYENLDEAMCKELEKLDKKYGGNVAEMDAKDAELADKLYHALKCAATWHAMKDAEEWEKDGDDGASGRMRDGRSYRRGRDSMGRFVSRDAGSGMYPMHDGYSGHYPEWLPGYYR